METVAYATYFFIGMVGLITAIVIVGIAFAYAVSWYIDHVSK